MRCSSTSDKILLYLDRDLPDEEMKSMAVHLAECADCQKVFEASSRIYRVIETDRVEPDRPYFFNRVMARLEHRAAEPAINWFRLRPVWLAAATVVPLMIGIWFGYSSYQQQTLDQQAGQLASEIHVLLTIPGYASLEEYSAATGLD